MSNTRLSYDEKIKICEYYNSGIKIIDIHKLLKRSKYSITQTLHRANITLRDGNDEKRRVFFNKNYFHTIDSEKKAYFLGLLCADGAIYNSKGQRHVMISLVEKDREILDLFAKDIGYSRSLYFIPRKPPRQNMVRLSLGSQEMVNDVCRLGCTPKKSFTLEFPSKEKIPDDLIWHFIRGFFDGDGCVCIYKNKLAVNLVSSHRFCRKIKSFVIQSFGHKIGNITKHHTAAKVSVYQVGGIYYPLKFLDKIYEGATIFLKRKHNKYIWFKNYIEERDRKNQLISCEKSNKAPLKIVYI